MSAIFDSPKSSSPFSWVWIPGWFLTIMAISGNSAVIYTIAVTRRLRTQVNVFILSLAIADFCFGLTYFPTFFTCEFYLPCDQELRRIFAAYFAFASLMNLCVMTADRYVAIVMPFKYVSIKTSKCVVTMVILSWLFPGIFYFGINIILNQTASEDVLNIFKISRVLVFQLTPCVYLFLATIKMFLIAHSQAKKTAALVAQLKFNHPTSSKKPKDGFEISSATFIAVVVFFTVLYYLVDSFLDLRIYFSAFRKTADTDYVLCLLFTINSAVNPLAYALMKHDIKKEFKRLLCQKWKKAKRGEETHAVLSKLACP